MIRNPKNEIEVSEIIDMLEICFPKMKREYFIRRILGDNNYRSSHTFILTKNNRIVSHAQIFNKKVWWDGVKINFIGLGFICTLPEFRNYGYSTSLLRYLIKEKGPSVLGLFTKIPRYYEKLGFSVIPRKRIVIKKTDYRSSLDRKLRIRKFDFENDIFSVMNIYKDYFSLLNGPIVRGFCDWQSQLSYFDEDKKLFLVLETGNEIKAYVRCRQPKYQPNKIDIVEYGSIDKNFMPDFIQYLFSISDVQEINSYKVFSDGHIMENFEVAEELDTLMMLKCKKKYLNNAIDNDKICFLQADGF